MIKMIVAHDKNRVIGLDNKMPWHHPEDLKYFKETTLHQNVLMGSRTLESVIEYLGRPLPKRHNILLTSRTDVPYEVELYHSVEDVVSSYKDEDIFIAGGRSVYEQFLPYTDYLYVTYIDEEYEGDTFFPDYDLNDWKLISSKKSGVLDFRIYERILK